MIDRRILLSSLGSGAAWLLHLALLGAWPLALIGAAYVVVASVYLSAVLARAPVGTAAALTWAVPWLAASALWVWLLAAIDGPGPGALVVGLALGTATFLAWQLSALALRRLLLPGHAVTVEHP